MSLTPTIFVDTSIGSGGAGTYSAPFGSIAGLITYINGTLSKNLTGQVIGLKRGVTILETGGVTIEAYAQPDNPAYIIPYGNALNPPKIEALTGVVDWLWDGTNGVYYTNVADIANYPYHRPLFDMSTTPGRRYGYVVAGSDTLSSVTTSATLAQKITALKAAGPGHYFWHATVLGTSGTYYMLPFSGSPGYPESAATVAAANLGHNKIAQSQDALYIALGIGGAGLAGNIQVHGIQAFGGYSHAINVSANGSATTAISGIVVRQCEAAYTGGAVPDSASLNLGNAITTLGRVSGANVYKIGGLFRENYAHHCYHNAFEMDATDGVIVEYNLAEHYGSVGCEFYNENYNSICRFNRFTANNGGTVDTGDDLISTARSMFWQAGYDKYLAYNGAANTGNMCYGNVLTNAAKNGMEIGAGANCLVYNNTIIAGLDGSATAAYGSMWAANNAALASSSGNSFYNNISTLATSALDVAYLAKNTTINNNLWYSGNRSANGYFGRGYTYNTSGGVVDNATTFTAWNTNVEGGTALAADPLLDADGYPTATSPAFITSGSSSGSTVGAFSAPDTFFNGVKESSLRIGANRAG